MKKMLLGIGIPFLTEDFFWWDDPLSIELWVFSCCLLGAIEFKILLFTKNKISNILFFALWELQNCFSAKNMRLRLRFYQFVILPADVSNEVLVMRWQ